MIARGFLLLIFLIPAVAWAQSPYTSAGGRFQVTEKRGCAPFTVDITRTDLQPSISCPTCVIVWGDGSTPQTDGVLSHTYTTPGTYTLVVNYQGTPGPDQIDITVYANAQPAFEIYTCSANQIQVRVTDTNYDSYIINYNDATPEVEVPRGSLGVSHTFATPGSKTVSVRGKNALSADNCTPPANKVVVVSAASPPVPTINQVTITSSTEIDLLMTTQQNVLYRLEMSTNGGTFQNLGNLLDVNTATIPNLNTDDNYYCFRLGVINPCAGGIPPYSASICSADLAVTAVNNANNLTWTTNTAGITNFTIERDGVVLTTLAGTSFSDTDVVCGTEYCYQIISNYVGARSLSTSRCVTAISTDIPTAISNVTSVVNENSVDLIWQPDAVFIEDTYSVFKRANSGSFNLAEGGLTVTAYTDANYSFANQNCYRIDYTDACGNTSNPGIVACPVILAYTTNTDNDIILTWSAYTGWTNGVNHYEVDKYDLTHSLIETFTLGNVITYTDTEMDDQGYYYVARAIPNDAFNGESVSNEIRAMRKLRFAYPKAFTPDNQGPAANETFKVFVTEEFIDSFEMKIFNRWGEMIFSTTDLLKGWDGKFNGEPQPEGTYTFTATLRDRTGKSYKRDGSVMLLRKK